MDLLVGNLPENVDEDELSKEFSDLGVTQTKVVRHNSGESKGYGFVRFESEDQAEKAVPPKNKTAQGWTVVPAKKEIFNQSKGKKAKRNAPSQHRHVLPGNHINNQGSQGLPHPQVLHHPQHPYTSFQQQPLALVPGAYQPHLMFAVNNRGGFQGRGRGGGRGDGRGGSRGQNRRPPPSPPTEAELNQLIETKESGMGIYISELEFFLQTMNVDINWLLAAARDKRTKDNHVWTGAEELEIGDKKENWMVLLSRLNLPGIVYAFDLNDYDRETIKLLPTLKFHRGMSICVFDFDSFPRLLSLQGIRENESHIFPKMHPTVKKQYKKLLMQPYFDFRAVSKPAFAHVFDPPHNGDQEGEKFIAQNSVMSSVHYNPETKKAHLFLLWADDKNNGEWCMPGGKVDISDDDLFGTARREWTEEVIGFDFDSMRDDGTKIYQHFVRKPESIKYAIDTHLFVRAGASFFESTKKGMGLVGHLATTSVDKPIYWQPPPPQQQQEEYFAGIGTPIEHVFYTWVPVELKYESNGGAVRDVFFNLNRSKQRPPIQGRQAKLRREITDKPYRDAIVCFLNSILEAEMAKNKETAPNTAADKARK